MRRALAFILMISFVSSLCSLLFGLNLKYSLFAADKVKKLAVESNAYEFIAASLREKIVKSGQLSGNDQTLEIVNEALSAGQVQSMGEQVIDNYFALSNGKKADPQLIIPIGGLEQNINSSIEKETGQALPAADTKQLLGGDLTLNLSRNSGYLTSTNSKSGLLILIGSTLISLLLFFLLAATTLSGRLIWLGWSLILAGLIFTVFTVLDLYLGPRLVEMALQIYPNLDAKLATSLSKLILTILKSQQLYLILETVALFLLGGLLLSLGRGAKEEKVELVRPVVLAAPKR